MLVLPECLGEGEKMINLEEFKNQAVEIRILDFRETVPSAISEYVAIMQGKLLTLEEIQKARGIATTPYLYLRKLEKTGIVARVVLEGMLYYGLVEDIKKLGEKT